MPLGGGILKHGTIKSGNWQKSHNKKADECNASAKDAAEFLQKAKVKDRNFQNLHIPDDVILYWGKLNYEILESLGIGVVGMGGAAGAAAATKAGLYAAAGYFGVASTGVRISTLTGAAAHSAKLAWLGGGALSAGGAGMAGGIARLAFAANIVTIPLSIATAAWAEWKAEQTKQKAEAKIKEFDQAIAKMQRQKAVMKAAQLRMAELTTSITESRAALHNLLAKSDVGKVEDAHQVYKLAKALAELLEQPTLTDAQVGELEG